MGTKMAAKLKKSNNIVVRLRLKEMRGSLQPHSHATPVKMFNKTIPDSLVFNLKDLVPLSVLHDGHVFLGFTKDGQFVLSYTQLMEAEAELGYPYYEYHLHWWVLRPVTPEQPGTHEQPGTPKRHFKLHKVSQVRLFGEEEILTDVYLLVCQWPTDHNKVLVHGYSYQSGATTPSSDEKCLCYLTVTAVPPAGPCKDCLQLPQDLDPPDPDDSFSTPVPSRCLKHSFTLHTKYELAPPFPPFHPKVSLKLDGVIVLNTADSLVALSIKTGGEDKEQSILLGGGDRELSIPSGGGDSELFIHAERGDRDLEQSRVDGKVDSNLQCENSTATRSCEDQVSSSDGHLEMQSSGSDSSYVFNVKVHSGNQEHVEDKVGDPCQKCGADSLNNKELCITDADGRCSTCAADDSSAGDVSADAHPGCQDILTGANSCIGSNNGSSSCECAKCCPCFRTKENKSQSEEIRESYTIFEYGTCGMKTTVPGTSEQCRVQTAQKTACTYTLSTDSTPLDSRDGKDCELSSDALSHAVCRNSTALHSKTPEGHAQPSDLSTASNSTTRYSTTSTVNSRTPEGHAQPSDLSTASDSTTRYSTTSTVNSRTPEGHAQPSDLSTASDSTTRYSTTSTVNSRTPEGHAQPSDLLSAASDSSSWDSTALDCSRSPCFTFTRRQYVYSTTDSGDHLEDTGESGSEYQSMLPLEVYGAGYSSMRLCMGENKGSTYYGQPGSVEVQELRMDAEQVICDMARQDAEWGNRFVAFTDYDMQIIDVCPDSRQLVVLVLALVRARPHYGNCIPKLYQTSFTAAWDLNTGHHQTRDIQPLQEFDQAQLKKVWNPGRAMSRKMQQRWVIPQGYARGVHVMTNEAVFRGHSLSLLWDSTNCIAIVPGHPGR